MGGVLAWHREQAGERGGGLVEPGQLPPGVEIPSLAKGDDLPVATIIIPRAVAAEEAAAVAAAEVPTTVQKKEGTAKEGEKKDAGKKK